jgi:DNA processing protein
LESDLPHARAPRGAATREPSASGLLDPRNPDPAGRRELEHWLRLQSTLGLRPQRAAELLRRTESPVAALALSGEPCKLSGAQLAQQVELLRRFGVTALPLLSRDYPPRLARLSDPATLLLLRGAGDAELLSRPAVAIVGARAASAYGLRVARQLASELASEGVVVISGLARGIDAAAHAGALDASGLTLAVQACGPERIYPRQNRALAEAIARDGLLISEMPPGTPPRAPYFPLRNRLISALARIVVVVEARLRSGSLVTARHALDQGGEVMAVPGPLGHATSEGANRLIRDGARPVLEAADILEELGQIVSPGGMVGSPNRLVTRLATRLPSQLPIPPFASATDTLPREPSDPATRRILKELRFEPASRDDLALRLGLPPSALAAPLLELEMQGLLACDRDGRLVTLPLPRGRQSAQHGPGGDSAG